MNTNIHLIKTPKQFSANEIPILNAKISELPDRWWEHKTPEEAGAEVAKQVDEALSTE